MKKILQNILYGISLLMVLTILAALILSGRKEPEPEEPEETELQIETEVPEAEEQPTETEKMPQQSEQPQAEEQPEAQEGAADETTTILFAGDVLFANAFKAGYDANGIEGVISAELLAELTEADIFMVNQEFPFGETGTPMADKQYTFQCSPSYVTALQEMGVDIVSLANNHVLDYGKESLRETFETLEKAGILYTGAGETAERASAVQMLQVNGRTYGFLAVSRVVPTGDWKVENSAPGVFSCYDTAGLLEVVTEASKECDFLAVYPHWGVEHAAYPQEYQTQIAEQCLAAGADIVAGSHTHCLQGAAYIEGKPVFYSLGNFVFGQNIDRSALLKVTIAPDGTTAYQYLPVYAAGGVTYLATEEKAQEICQYLDELSPEAVVDAQGVLKN